ncbi:hypothetical protein [Hymenobacter glacieicola]|uniref:DUF4177 domain-containing protein n=1 Tax=Hymenobacter glacieicola TaxID=1562124 RepID=A0ABQ1WFU9_9BACT|nr:hypothetical protein [Hymenobacter glacieicola]GGG29083.1 hypothetical protein GCM10011378_02190 [Hymenobacter glacieicola]
MILRFLLLSGLLGTLQLSGAAQTDSSKPASDTHPALPSLPESALQPTVAITQAAAVSPGTRFMYQQIRAVNNEKAFLAPAWHGLLHLEPDVVQEKRRTSRVPGSLDVKVMQTLNELAEEGWELMEVYKLVQPVGAEQSITSALGFMEPTKRIVTGYTSINSYLETRYLLRRPLPTAAK